MLCGLTPYFLEKPDFWFDENTASMLEAAKSQSFFKDNVFLCQKNQEYNFSQFLRRLDELGYEKVAFISEPGEFSRRGGIIDVFPVNLLYAVRLEFYGNLLLAIEQLPLAVTDGQAARKLLLKKIKRQKIFSDLSRLAAGDYIVHLDHGIGRFLGREKAGKEEYYILGYAQNDKLYIHWSGVSLSPRFSNATKRSRGIGVGLSSGAKRFGNPRRRQYFGQTAIRKRQSSRPQSVLPNAFGRGRKIEDCQNCPVASPALLPGCCLIRSTN